MSNYNKIKRNSLSSQVEEVLKNMMIVGKFKPGMRILPREISQELGTSITPVREAIFRMVSLSALQISSTNTFMIPEMTLSLYDELNKIRKLLESVAAITAAEKINDSRLNYLRECMHTYTLMIDKGNVFDILKAKYDFHFSLYKYSEMPVLIAFIEQLWIRLGPSYNYLQLLSSDVLAQPVFFEELFSALRKRESEKIREAIIKNIDKDKSIIQNQFMQ